MKEEENTTKEAFNGGVFAQLVICQDSLENPCVEDLDCLLRRECDGKPGCSSRWMYWRDESQLNSTIELTHQRDRFSHGMRHVYDFPSSSLQAE